MNNFKQIQDAIINAIHTIVENKFKNIKRNYYVDGVVKNKNNDNTYDVLIANVTYKNIPSKYKLNYEVEDIVQILVKNGDWNKKFIDGFSHNNKFPITDYVYPVGSICIRETKSDPVDTLGGIWTLVDKEFTSLYVEDASNTYFTPQSDVVSSCTVRIVRTGHTITIKVYLTIPENISLTDTTATLGSLNYEALGISEFPTNRSFPIGYSDGGNAIIMGYLYGDTGVLTANDIVGADSISNTTLYFDFTETVTSKFMLNNACNKFYWKRKA